MEINDNDVVQCYSALADYRSQMRRMIADKSVLNWKMIRDSYYPATDETWVKIKTRAHAIRRAKEQTI